ncbi:MAG: OmpA family protein [Bdellovibrionales bacterium]|nr:OmpA family protein [Bdellovibrionales bacterium]
MKFMIGFLLLVTTSTSFAQYDLTGRWGVGVGAGINSVLGPDVFTEGATELDGGFHGSAWARYHVSSRFGLELSYSRMMFKFKDETSLPLNGRDPAVDAIDFNLAYRMFPLERWHALFQVGAGYARISDVGAGTDSEDDFTWKARAGAEYMATPDLMLAVYADYRFVNLGSGTDSKIEVLSPLLGLTYYFGGKSSAKASPDSDGDGVYDDQDKCPNTPANANVGGDGCPLTTQKGDADGDGVADAEDKCPNSERGQPVTEFGCTKTDKLEITLNVQFKPGSAIIDPKFTEDLKKFAEFLKQYPDTTTEIEGHTDNTGSEKQNYSISQKRANAVMNYLVKQKIDKKRLTAKGYGPSQAVGDNNTPEGREKNRRVVAHVQSTK